ILAAVPPNSGRAGGARSAHGRLPRRLADPPRSAAVDAGLSLVTAARASDSAIRAARIDLPTRAPGFGAYRPTPLSPPGRGHPRMLRGAGAAARLAISSRGAAPRRAGARGRDRGGEPVARDRVDLRDALRFALRRRGVARGPGA